MDQVGFYYEIPIEELDFEEKICQKLETKAYRQCGGTPIQGGKKRKEI